MPMSSKIGCLVRHDDNVPDASFDHRLAPGTLVFLPGLIWLDRLNDLVGEFAEDVSHIGRRSGLGRHDV